MRDQPRTYAKGWTRIPVPYEQRKQRGPKYMEEDGQWVGTHWFPTVHIFLPEDARPEIPETRPDDTVLEHRWGCRCGVCVRPEAVALKRRTHRRQMRMARSSTSSST